MELMTPEPEIVYEFIIEFDYGNFGIYYNVETKVWIASHYDENEFDDDFIIQDNQNLFVKNMELFEGFILTVSEFKKLEEMIKNS